MRTRLLDLSSRNPLLNYRHPQGSSLRIIDEVPSAIFDRLVLPGGLLLNPVRCMRSAAHKGNAAAISELGLIDSMQAKRESCNRMPGLDI